MKRKTFLIVMIMLNAIVLLGQIWPEGAPAFARWVNIFFLIVSLMFFAGQVQNSNKNRKIQP